MKQKTDGGFVSNLLTDANEHSKKLTIIDTGIFFLLMVALLAIMCIWPSLAKYCVSAMGYVVAAYVGVRSGYTVKAMIENYNKIKTKFAVEEDDEDEEEDQG